MKRPEYCTITRTSLQCIRTLTHPQRLKVTRVSNLANDKKNMTQPNQQEQMSQIYAALSFYTAYHGAKIEQQTTETPVSQVHRAL